MKKKKKGQAAIEFLSTYSWAIMAILITLGVLAYFDLFDRERYMAEGCDTGAQLQCLEIQLRENGEVALNLRNNYAENIEISNVYIVREGNLYTSNQVAGESEDEGERESAIINRGERAIINAGQMGGDFSSGLREGSKISLDLILEFGRADGDRRYNVTGNAVVRVVN